MSSETNDEFAYDTETAVVTGAMGDVGSRVADRLAERGVHVVGIDRDRPTETRPNLSFRAVDLRDATETWETIHEADPDAVVHCAAITDPLTNPGTRVFDNNTSSTYNTLVAAGRADAEVVWTSSQAAYGALFSSSTWMPDYLPIDEDHPREPEDPYGISKVCSEEIAQMVARRYDVPVTTIRPATVRLPDEHRSRPPKEDADLGSDEIRGSFGSFVDVRDVVRMVEAALAADRAGHETYLCVADENYLGPATTEIVEAMCGSLPENCELDGQQAALSNAKARAELGWEPSYPDSGDDEPPSWL